TWPALWPCRTIHSGSGQSVCRSRAMRPRGCGVAGSTLARQRGANPPGPSSGARPPSRQGPPALPAFGEGSDGLPVPADLVGGEADLGGLGHRAFGLAQLDAGDWVGPGVDRKSTRLNSSHVKISYAVFCSKKKIIASLGTV